MPSARTPAPRRARREDARKPRDATLPEVVGAVFSSFLGIRKGKAMQKDAVSIKPHQVVLVGIALAAVFVVSLLLLVRVIIRAAGA